MSTLEIKDLHASVTTEGGAKEWEALEADARFAHVLHGGTAHTGEGSGPLGAEEEEFLGIPGLLTPEQTAELLAKRDDELRLRVEAARRIADDDEHFLLVEDHPDESDAGRSWRSPARCSTSSV